MTTKEELIDALLVKTTKWYESKTKILRELADTKNDVGIRFVDKEGKMADLQEDKKGAFILGVKIALDALKDFPIATKKKSKTV